MDQKKILSFTNKKSKQLEEVQDQKTSSEKADIMTHHIELTGCLIQDFFDDVRKMQRQAKKQNRPAPSFFRTVDDLVKLVDLYLRLFSMAQDETEKLSLKKWKAERNQLIAQRDQEEEATKILFQ